MPRRLGQHFLREPYAERLLELVRPAADETFLEIGPGHGALTLPLARRAARVVGLELDARLAQRLRESAGPNVEIAVADALVADWQALVPRGSRLVGNLPYYISSPLLRRALLQRGHFRDAHLTVQEEVAERVAAGPGSKNYGILSVFFGLWTRTEVAMRLPPHAFSPPPKVRSAVLEIRFDVPPAAPVSDPAALERLVKKAFTHRRKTLENNLQDSYPNLKEHLRLLNIVGSRRAETLSVVEFAQLAASLQAHGGLVRADG